MVDVVFLVVDSFSPKFFAEFLMTERTILNVTFKSGVTKSLVGDDLEEGSTAGSRLPQNQNHFSWLCDTLEVFKDVELLPFLAPPKDAHDCLWDIEEVNDGIRESLHNIPRAASASDGESIPNDTWISESALKTAEFNTV